MQISMIAVELPKQKVTGSFQLGVDETELVVEQRVCLV
jgi:hypothetical protein